MALQREYFPSDTLKLINQSESYLVRGGKRQTPSQAGEDEDKGAHSIGRHLLKGAPGARGLGIGYEEFRDRFLNSPENLSSAWIGKGEMAILLCELLNSDVGQLALQQLDNGVRRVVVHYLNQGKLKNLFYGLAGKARFKESEIIVTPASQKIVLKDIYNSKTGAFIKQIQQTVTIPKSSVAQVKAKDIASVNAVLDRYGSNLHLQTLYPSSEAATSYAEWRVGSVQVIAAFDKGTLITRMAPVG